MHVVRTILRGLVLLVALLFAVAQEVVVETTTEGSGMPLTKGHTYVSSVTLYLENKDKTRTKPIWSTRKEHGAEKDVVFEFEPGMKLLKGWTEGVLKMTIGERALLHVPSKLGYGDKPMGKEDGAFYIPANSDLLFDIEIVAKKVTDDQTS